MIDKYYTPDKLAASLSFACSSRNVHSIADFAVGDGALLRVAKKRWPGARLFGCDIDPAALSQVRQNLPEAELLLGDFLDPDTFRLGRNASSYKYDLVLLNPPFSIRGGQFFNVDIFGTTFKCSRAFAFIGQSITHLSCNGELVAIVPSYSLENDLDSDLRSFLAANFDFRALTQPSTETFRGCQVQVSIVRLTMPKGLNRTVSLVKASPEVLEQSCNGPEVSVQRGSLPAVGTRFQSSGVPFCHTTDLGSNLCTLRYVDWSATRRIVEGPAILIPRVGRPRRSSVCVIRRGVTVAPSDCVISLKSRYEAILPRLLEDIFANWAQFEAAYTGTGARFITVQRLFRWLREIGYRPVAACERKSIEKKEALLPCAPNQFGRSHECGRVPIIWHSIGENSGWAFGTASEKNGAGGED